MSEKNELVKQEVKIGSAFSNITTFENAQRMASALCKSSLVPKAYQSNIPNTMVAMEMAVRIGISPLMVMQNLDIIQGKPSWRSSFIISALNSCGRFKPLRFQFEGNPDSEDYGCRAYSFDIETKEKITGPKVDWKMVKAEGWLSKSGSKWKTMPELMFQYRAASFFGRLYAPDILTGMHSVEEMTDINSENMKKEIENNKHEELVELYSRDFDISEEDRLHIERVINEKEVLSYDKAIKALKIKIEEYEQQK